MKKPGHLNHSSLTVSCLVLSLAWAITPVHANTIVLVPTLGGTMGTATDLNNAGQVVGFATLAGDQLQHGFLFSGNTITDLGTLGGLSSQANCINDLGHILGQSDVPGGGSHAFLFVNGALNDLGTLGGTISSGNDMNQAGHVVGYAFLPGNPNSHAFLHLGGAMLDLGTLGGSSSSAIAINNNGDVVGDSSMANGHSHPFIYQNGTMADLGTLGGTYGIPWDVNDAGVVVGESETSQFETHAFLYAGGTMVDLGTLGGSFSFATALNEAGHIIGDSYTANDAEYHAFVYMGGTMIDLGTLGGTYSSALAVNQAGQIVGDSTDVSEMTFPFLWHNGAMVDLNTLLPPNSGWELWSAFRINDAGQILGYGLYNGQFRYYMLTLQSENRPPVAQAGPDQTLQCSGSVALDGSASSDPDGDALTYAWVLNGVTLATGVNPSVTLPAGSHVLHLTVSDPAGATATDSVQITIADTMAPTVSCPLSRTQAAGANCSAPVPDLTGSVVVVDNCASSSALQRTQSPAAGTLLGVGTYDVVVTVTDPSGNSASCTTQFVVTDNTLPVIVSCPPPVSAAAGRNSAAPMPNFAANLSATDNCSSGAGLVVSQVPAPGTLAPLGTHVVTLTVTDASGNQASCTTSFSVVDRTPPSLTCPAPVTVNAGTQTQVPMPNVLRGVVVSDNVTPASQITLIQTPAAGTLVGPGVYQVTVNATDAAGNNATCGTTVTVVAETSCRLVVHSRTVSPDVLWPANGKMVAVTVTVNAESTCGRVVSRILEVHSDEPATDGQDIQITGNLTLNLRAERSSQGDGRVYTVTVESLDSRGNRSVGTVLVDVPRKNPGDTTTDPTTQNKTANPNVTNDLANPPGKLGKVDTKKRTRAKHWLKVLRHRLDKLRR